MSTELKTVSRTSNQPKHSEKGESHEISKLLSLTTFLVVASHAGGIRTVGADRVLINLQLARCASSLLNQELCRREPRS